MSTLRVFKLLALVLLAMAALAAPVLADSGPSAGDQQYVDPLSGTHHSKSSGTTHTTATTVSSGPSTPSNTATAATATSTSGTATSAAAGSTTSGKTLPFTGYDGTLAAALGAGLIGGGLLLRRRLPVNDR